jgi:hypothetical protein
MGTPEASAALEAGTQGRGRKVKGACAEALARITTGPAPKS